MDKLNIAENRNHLNYSKWIYIKRILWTFGKFFFRNSPRIAFGYRNTILRLFGAKIGKHVHIYSSTVIWFPWNLEIGNWSAIGEETLIYNLGKVTIGEKATVSHRVHVCAGTHDYTNPALPLLRPEIRIGNQTWICADMHLIALNSHDLLYSLHSIHGMRRVLYQNICNIINLFG